MTNEIPTTAEQIELATRVKAALAQYAYIDGRYYRVTRWAYEIRFLGVPRFQGENPPSAHIACLRSDIAVAQVLPCEHQDRKLAEACQKIVAGVLARVEADRG